MKGLDLELYMADGHKQLNQGKGLSLYHMRYMYMCVCLCHRNSNCFQFDKILSLVTLEVVISTPLGASDEENFIKMNLLSGMSQKEK